MLQGSRARLPRPLFKSLRRREVSRCAVARRFHQGSSGATRAQHFFILPVSVAFFETHLAAFDMALVFANAARSHRLARGWKRGADRQIRRIDNPKLFGIAFKGRIAPMVTGFLFEAREP